MLLTASPFDATTGALLPVYRDAYLRGDLTRENSNLVDAYLRQNATLGAQTWDRFHAMQQTGEQVQAVGWMQRQVELVRTSPRRVRQQVASLLAVTVLIGGAVFANNTTPTKRLNLTLPVVPTEEVAGARRMTTVHGRILDENGHPLAGATVLEKGTRRAVSTNADGEYTLLVPAGRPTTLAYGYAGYSDDETLFDGQSMSSVVLLPKAKSETPRKAKRWLLF